MPFNLDKTMFYAIKNKARDNYTIRATPTLNFYADSNWNNRRQEAYRLNVSDLAKDQRTKILKSGGDQFDLIKSEYSEEELTRIFGADWNEEENKIEFEKEVGYNFAKLTNLKHIGSEKEAQSLVEVLNARLKTTNAYELKKFEKNAKDGTATYTLAVGEREYTVIQNNDGSTDINSQGDAAEFSNRLLDTADILRANTKANLKSAVIDAIKNVESKIKKYEIAKEMLGIVSQQLNSANNASQKPSQSASSSSAQGGNNETKPRATTLTPTITFNKLKPIYKKKDNNKDDEFLDYPKYEKIADDWFKKGYLVNARPMIDQKDEQGNFIFSDDARKKLSDIFDITTRDENALNTFCDYYMGDQTENISAHIEGTI